MVVFHVMKQLIWIPKRDVKDSHGVKWRGNQINIIGDEVEQLMGKYSVQSLDQSLFSSKKYSHSFSKLALCSSNGF